jgi:cobalamin biosynthesis protein CbiD
MNIVPRYAHIKTQTYNIAARKTQIQAQTLRIKNEIKCLYKKIQQINKELYYTHIQSANILKSVWNNIEQSINKKLQEEMKTIYEKQQQKIRNLFKLQKQTIKNTPTENKNYPRIKKHH